MIDDWHPWIAARLVFPDVILMRHGDTDIIEAVQESMLREIIQGEFLAHAEPWHRNGSGLYIHNHFQEGVLQSGFHQFLAEVLVHLHGYKTRLGGVVAEDIAKFG